MTEYGPGISLRWPWHFLQGQCGLQIEARTESFAACQSLPRRSPDSDIDFLYTLTDNLDGTSNLRVAFDAMTPGWVSWGIPPPGGGMLGSSVVIVQEMEGGTGERPTYSVREGGRECHLELACVSERQCCFCIVTRL